MLHAVFRRSPKSEILNAHHDAWWGQPYAVAISMDFSAAETERYI